MGGILGEGFVSKSKLTNTPLTSISPPSAAMRRACVMALLLVVLAECYAQDSMAVGTYGLASAESFSNSSAFVSTQTIVVTQGVLEITEKGVQGLVSMRLTDGNSEVLLTLVFNIGYSPAANAANVAITDCTENTLQGNGFGFSVCAAANSENGCSRAIGWGQGTVDTPFTNRTLIVTANFCSLIGTQLWQCGAVGGCDGVVENELALPTGDYVLNGIPPAFVYENPQSNAVSLSTSTLSNFNNHEYLLVFTFVGGSTSLIIRIYGAVVVDQSARLLFSFYNCSQATFGGPAPLDVCVLLNSGGCETSIADSQVDVTPPQNDTVIQLPQWCNFFGNLQYKCNQVGSCEGPINRASAASQIGFTAGECLAFSGDALNVVGGCSLENLTVNQLNVNQLNVNNMTIQQQTVVQQSIENQTVLFQNSVVTQTGDLFAQRIYFAGRTSQFYVYTTISIFLQFLDENFLPCGSAYNPGSGPPYPIPVTIQLERIGSLVHGLMTFASNAAARTSVDGCNYFGTGASQIPSFARPAQAVQGRTSQFLVVPGVLVPEASPTCTVSLRMIVRSNGNLYWMPYKPDLATQSCGVGVNDYVFGAFVEGFNATQNFFIGNSYPDSPPSGANQFDFAYTLDNYT